MNNTNHRSGLTRAAEFIAVDNTPMDPEKLKEILNDAQEDKKDGLSNQSIGENKDLLLKIYAQGMKPGEAIGVTKDQVNWLYNLSYRFYQSGKLDNACLLFRFLTKLDPEDAKYPMGVGGCYMQQAKYDKAVEAFMQATFGREQIPDPWYYMAECYMKLNQVGAAMICYGAVIQLAGDNPKYANVKERSDLTFKALTSKMAENLEKD